MKAKGIRVFAVLFILIGIAVGSVAAILVDEMFTRFILFALCVAIGGVIGAILFAVANAKEKREKIRAAMEAAEEAVEDASIFDPVEEPAPEVALEEVVSDLDELLDVPSEEEAEVVEEAPKYHPAYQYVRDKIVEKTPITNEQLDKAEQIGKVAIPVAAAATVVLMAAKLVQYRKQEIRRRTFFDWLG